MWCMAITFYVDGKYYIFCFVIVLNIWLGFQGCFLSATSHSAVVERFVSYYNVKKSSLSPDTIKDAFYIKVNMPTLSKFDPLPAIKLWLNKKSRHNLLYIYILE